MNQRNRFFATVIIIAIAGQAAALTPAPDNPYGPLPPSWPYPLPTPKPPLPKPYPWPLPDPYPLPTPPRPVPPPKPLQMPVCLDEFTPKPCIDPRIIYVPKFKQSGLPAIGQQDQIIRF